MGKKKLKDPLHSRERLDRLIGTILQITTEELAKEGYDSIHPTETAALRNAPDTPERVRALAAALECAHTAQLAMTVGMLEEVAQQLFFAGRFSVEADLPPLEEMARRLEENREKAIRRRRELKDEQYERIRQQYAALRKASVNENKTAAKEKVCKLLKVSLSSVDRALRPTSQR